MKKFILCFLLSTIALMSFSQPLATKKEQKAPIVLTVKGQTIAIVDNVWSQCSATWWVYPEPEFADLHSMAEAVVEGLHNDGYGCVCKSERVDYIDDGWNGKQTCITVTVHEATTCPCLLGINNINSIFITPVKKKVTDLQT